MAIKLTITQWNDPSSQYLRAILQDRSVIGRSRSGDICLPDMSVSTRHAEIKLRGNDYVIVDLDSVNGTEVNGKELIAHRPFKLTDGDTIGIGPFRIQFRLGVAAANESRNISNQQARQMLSRTLGRRGEQSTVQVLTVLSGPGRGNRFELPDPPDSVFIGRDRNCLIRLNDVDISRKHAEIKIEKDGIFVKDLRSRNGVLIDGERAEAAKLEIGLKFTLGNTTLALEHPADCSLAAIYEAPEEQTTASALGNNSFQIPTPDPPSEPTPIDSQMADRKTREVARPSVKQTDPLPIGPTDPLVGDEQPRPYLRTTGTIPTPPTEEGSDLGMIIVSAIIVLAAVAGLVYIFS